MPVIFAISVLIVFITGINLTKVISSDLYWYVDWYQQLANTNLGQFLIDGGLSIRATEPVFYLLLKSMSVISSGNIPFFIITITFIVYGLYSHALIDLSSKLLLPNKLMLACIVFAICGGVTFTQSTHLIRQYLAASLLFYFFVTFQNARRLKLLALVLIGTFVHNSFIIPALFVVISFYTCKHSAPNRVGIWHYVMIAIAGYCIGHTLIIPNIYLPEYRLAVSDGEVSEFVLLFDISLASTGYVIYHFLRKRSDFPYLLFSAAMLFITAYISFLVAIYPSPILFLRFYFYIEFFRVIFVIMTAWALITLNKNTFSIYLLGFAGIVIMELRALTSPWDYGGDVFSHLFYSIPQWIDRIEHVYNF